MSCVVVAGWLSFACCGVALAAEPEKPPPAGEVFRPFDGKSLDGWKITPFGGQGDVDVKDASLILEMGNDMTGITWTKA